MGIRHGGRAQRFIWYPLSRESASPPPEMAERTVGWATGHHRREGLTPASSSPRGLSPPDAWCSGRSNRPRFHPSPPGPFCTQLLCNLGADVIKVEDPQLGDYMRLVPPIVRDVSYPFAMVNRGKRSLAVDLKTSEGQEILRRLVGRADIIVEQFRPGVMPRLGADYDGLAMWNPKLIYCSFSGYGQNGPYKDLPGH